MTHVVVVGGGIGGLAAAGFLHRAGLRVTVLERSGSLGDVGAGIQVSPNASRLLADLGVLDRVLDAGVQPDRSVRHRWQDGSVVTSRPLRPAMVERYGFPYVVVHRADLVDALASALPPGCLRLGVRAEAVEDHGPAVTVRTTAGPVPADVVLGADGVHSVVREHVLATPRRPSFSGDVAYRATVPAADVDVPEPAREVHVWMGPGAHLVAYAVRRGTVVNLVACVETGRWAEESWDRPGDVADLRAHFAGWAPEVRALLDRVTGTHVWGLFHDDPLPRWSRGRVALLGDACHPMLPYLAQGGSQAIEDAVTLAELLAGRAGTKPSDVPGLLRRYQDLRRPRTSALQQAAIAVRRSNHLPDGPDQRERDDPARSATGRPSAVPDVYGHDARAVAVGALAHS
ncbi:MAG: FAD-dependent monooxygenase [Kineosporiaceae bacterium]